MVSAVGARVSLGATATTQIDFDQDQKSQCEAIWQATLDQKYDEQKIRRQPPLVRVCDGDWNLQHILRDEYKATFSFISNDSGPGQTDIPFESPVAQWIYDEQGRMDRGEKRNVHIAVDYCGARWSGRLDKASVISDEDGIQTLSVSWLHDYENLKWYTVWSNPFLPAAFQMPRAFVLAGPVPWILKTSLFFQVWREHNPIITIPDDPLDFGSYFEWLDVGCSGQADQFPRGDGSRRGVGCGVVAVGELARHVEDDAGGR